jgi:hypothetical protein
MEFTNIANNSLNIPNIQEQSAIPSLDHTQTGPGRTTKTVGERQGVIYISGRD